LIAIDQHDQIAAHSISYVDQWQRLGSVAIHLQMELRRDPPILASDRNQMRELGRSLIEDWARSLKLKTILGYTLDASAARLHKRDGFHPFRIVVRKDLEG